MKRILLVVFLIVPFSAPQDSLQAQSNEFVTVRDGKFYLDDRPFYFGGTNAYDLPTLENWNPSSVDARLNACAAANVKVVRVFLFMDGATRCDQAPDNNTIQNPVGVYNARALRSMDRAIKKIMDRNIKIIATLTNFQNAGGGLGWYMYWTGKLAKPCDFSIYNAKQMYAALTDVSVKKAIKDYFSMILNRVNTVTGIAYKNEPAIMAWEIANEPSARGNNPTLLRDWLREMAKHIKSVDSNHLVGTGEVGFDDRMTGRSSYFNGFYGLNGEEGESFTLNTQIPEIDFATIHVYPMLWGTQWNADPIKSGELFIEDANSIAQSYGKPLILGEYGHASSAWYYPGPNDQAKLKAYRDWWALIEQTPVGGDLLWQFLNDGAPWWHNYSSANVYYRADNQIWPPFKQHNLNMIAKWSGSIPKDTIPPTITAVSSSDISASAATITWTTNEDATTEVEYGPTKSYGSLTQPSSGFSVSHSQVLTDLTANTLYHYRVKSRDLSENLSTSSDFTFTSAPTPPPSAIVSDDFNLATLNTSLWTFINPLGDASLKMVQSDKQHGLLSIAIPAGKSHDIWRQGNKAPRILQVANNTDFEIEVKYESALSRMYQIQGIIVEANSTNYLRLEFHSDSSNTKIFAATFLNGIPASKINSAIAPNAVAPLYLRVRRQADLWTLSYSLDGKKWVIAGSFTYVMGEVSRVGPFIGNEGNPAPAFTGLIDYFLNTASPATP
jgi:regulation of enolase protein 1 (concanavalin A-like superfamily)